MNNFEQEFEIDSQLYNFLKEVIKPKRIGINLEKLEKDIQSSVVTVKCEQEDISTINISYTINPVFCELILDCFLDFLKEEYNIILSDEELFDKFVKYQWSI